MSIIQVHTGCLVLLQNTAKENVRMLPFFSATFDFPLQLRVTRTIVDFQVYELIATLTHRQNGEMNLSIFNEKSLNGNPRFG